MTRLLEVGGNWKLEGQVALAKNGRRSSSRDCRVLRDGTRAKILGRLAAETPFPGLCIRARLSGLGEA